MNSTPNIKVALRLCAGFLLGAGAYLALHPAQAMALNAEGVVEYGYYDCHTAQETAVASYLLAPQDDEMATIEDLQLFCAVVATGSAEQAGQYAVERIDMIGNDVVTGPGAPIKCGTRAFHQDVEFACIDGEGNTGTLTNEESCEVETAPAVNSMGDWYCADTPGTEVCVVVTVGDECVPDDVPDDEPELP